MRQDFALAQKVGACGCDASLGSSKEIYEVSQQRGSELGWKVPYKLVKARKV